MTSTPARSGTGVDRVDLRRGLRVSSGLTLLSVLGQFITAGQLFPGGGPERLHAGGAIVLHVLAGVTAVAAVLLARRDRSQMRIAVLAVVVFAATFVQAAVGGRSTLWIHVPGAMVLTAGVVWLFVATCVQAGARRDG